MTAFDEDYIAWVAGTYALRPEMVRGMLAAFYTMRARRFPEAIDSIKSTIAAGENALKELPQWEKTHPHESAADKAMWEKLLPQLREYAR